MNQQRLAMIIRVLCILFFVLPYMTRAEQIHNSLDPVANWNKDFFFVEEGPVRQATLYKDGSVIDLRTQRVAYPIINSDMTHMTPDDFKKMVLSSRAALEKNPNKILVSGERGRGPNIVFDVTDPPPGAVAALESIATYIENLFLDTVTIYIDIGFDSLPPGVLGWAITTYVGPVPWNNTRTGLVNDMDGDDSIELWLPSGTTIPVRYEYTSSTVTNENCCWFALADYRAAIGYMSGTASEITFSNQFSWDYDPRDGVTAFCFQSVTAHELGHALGFLCGAWMYNEITTLDIYRFQRSDSIFDYNPDDLSEFQTTARMVDESPGIDDVITDVISVEYRMSDGDPYQCSHFSMGNVNAIMQPAFSSGQTYYPYFYRDPDRRMFDAIGWDYLFYYHLMTGTFAGSGVVVRDPDSSAYLPGTAVELTAIPDAGWELVGWMGDLSGSQNPDTIIMDTDKTVSAAFQTINCTLTVYVVGNGTVLKNPDLPYYPRGTAVELTAVPDAGWEFHHWSGSLGGYQNPDTIYMFGDKTVTAHFIETGIAEDGGQIIETTFLDVFPNPFSERTTIRYGIATSDRAKDAHVTIYDVTGQLVKRFSLPSTSTAILFWDGRDTSGRRAPSGVYFVQLETSSYKATQQILLLK
ncbi:MAG: T9SS type A sorting domain-containing protein [candidate division WOR-3 bacterium]|nr:MAG: T9SS type A sorting domain-containing protein [candidate division WOR-3 bacterium]